MRGMSESDDWAAQVVQDLMTQGLSEYSEMTVIDRANEALIIEEQKKSEKNAYSDKDYLELGRITQAQYLLVGSITNAGGIYRLSLSVNDGTTNEIKASFNQSVSLEDIQNGNATNAALLKLLTSLGFTLSESEKAELSKKAVDSNQNASTVNLAKGMAAEARANTVEAMVYYAQSGEKEASIRYDKISTAISTGNIRDDVKNDIEARNSWLKVYADLQKLANTQAVSLNYDTNHGETETDYKTETVSIPFKYSYTISSDFLKIFKKIEKGLNKTGKREKWTIRDEVTGATSDFKIEIPIYQITFALKNSDGVALGKVTETLSNFELSQMLKDKSYVRSIEKEIVFEGVPYQKITDSLSLSVDEVIVYKRLHDWSSNLYDSKSDTLLAKNPPIRVNYDEKAAKMASLKGALDVDKAAEAIRGLTASSKIVLVGKMTREKAIEISKAVTECKAKIFLDLSALEYEEGSSNMDFSFGLLSTCNSLESITIRGDEPWTRFPYFYDCPALKEIVLKDIDDYVFSDGAIYRKDYYGNLTELHLVLPKTIESFVVADGVEEIGFDAFAYCKNLKSVTLPLSLKKIGSSAFEGCESLSEVKYAGTKKDWKKVNIDKEDNEFLINAAKKCIK